MRNNGKGWFCPNKNEDGSWCKYKGEGQQGSAPQHTASPAKKEETDWGAIGKQKALCGMVNGMLSAGKTPKEVSDAMVELNAILNRIQTLSGVPAFKPMFTPPATQSPADVASMLSRPAPSDDYEDGNKALDEITW
jgi:hypothetical protein